MKLNTAVLSLTWAVVSSLGTARVLLQDNMASETLNIPPASNTSLAVPTYSYLLGAPARSPVQAPLASQLEDLTNSLAPALAPIALVSEMIGATGRRLKQADLALSVPSPAPSPSPEAICSPVSTLLPSSFASLGQTLALAPTLASLPSSNYTLVVPSDSALTNAAGGIASLTTDPSALQQVISQGLIFGKDLKLENGDVLTTRAPDSSITVTRDGQGVVTLKTGASSAKVVQMMKSCTVDLLVVDGVLLPGSISSSTLG